MPALKFTWHTTAPANLRAVFDQCVKQMANPLSLGGITLVLSGMRPASQTIRHLAGRNSPKGEIVADGDGNTQLVRFAATDVLAWMTANKFCSVDQVAASEHPQPESGQ